MAPNTKKVLLVDGYNVLRAGTRYSHLISAEKPDHSSDAFNAGREALLGDIAAFAGREYQATVVFDAAGNPKSRGEPQSFGGINVVFSPSGTSADSVIEAMAREAAAQNKEVLVVSSDANVQWTVMGRQVQRMSAAGFCNELEAESQELTELITPGSPGVNTPATKNTLADRLDPKTRAALEQLARKFE
ncbi:ribonuclease [Actinomycetota bacterium]|nr:ribonuclease [Actinomycetota bacterium]